MTNENNGFHEDSQQEIRPSVAHPAPGSDVQNLIVPAIKQTVSQYHNLLRQGLEQEVNRIIHEFEAATAKAESSMTMRIKSRMMELVHEEVRRVFDDALSNAESSLIDPTREMGRNPRPPTAHEETSQLVQEQVLIEGAPVAREDESEHTPEADDEDNDEGGGRVNAFWTTQDNQEADDFFYPEPIPVEAQIVQDENINLQLATDQTYDEPAPITEDEVYEGTVRLNVEANGCIRQVVHFVRELRQKPQLRLLRLVGNNREGVDILLGLREPLHLRKMLPQIEGVSIVSTPLGNSESGHERLLNVRLTAEADPYPWTDAEPVTSPNRVVA